MTEKQSFEGQSPIPMADQERLMPLADADSVPDPEVSAPSRRRHFSAAYKRSIIEQAESCQEPGEVGALLRREGLYSSHLSDWRRAQRQGVLESSKTRSRGPRAEPIAARRQLAELEAKNARLEKELEKARTIIEVQKKLSLLLSMNPNDGTSS